MLGNRFMLVKHKEVNNLARGHGGKNSLAEQIFPIDGLVF